MQQINYHITNIEPIWDIKEVENLEYFTQPFTDTETLDKWKSIYNKTFTLGSLADYRSKQPEVQHKIVSNILDNISDLGSFTNFGFNWFKMVPGDVIPYHEDAYINYRKYYNVKYENVWRAVVLLQDWHPGFILEIDGNPLYKYSAGTVAMWRGDTSHLVANYGVVPRYTLQITMTKL